MAEESVLGLIGKLLLIGVLLGGLWMMKLYLGDSGQDEELEGDETAPPRRVWKIPLLCGACAGLGFILIYALWQ